MTGLMLMENAGSGCARRIASLFHSKSQNPSGVGEVVVLCGKGNNGGDGYVIARHLELLNIPCTLVTLTAPEDLTGDARVNAMVAMAGELPRVAGEDRPTWQSKIEQAAIIVDCLLGTGAVGPPREPFASAIRLANQASGLRVAIDLPSGLGCDSGEPSDPTFRASFTLTMVAEKAGFGLPTAKPYLGCVEVVSIGVPRKLVQSLLSERLE
jgi:NAD(P)H-hydrate epimerase